MTSDINEEPPADSGLEVSFAQVAAEPAADSVSHEHEATGELEDDEAGAPPSESAATEENDTPRQPTISSMLGVGPVTPGDDPTI